MRDEFIHLQFTRHVIVDQIRELGAAFDAAKGTAFPYAARDELECCEGGVLVLFFLLFLGEGVKGNFEGEMGMGVN